MLITFLLLALSYFFAKGCVFILVNWSLAKIQYQLRVGAVREPPLPEKNSKNANVQLVKKAEE
jgi:hypothetical protein